MLHNSMCTIMHFKNKIFLKKGATFAKKKVGREAMTHRIDESL